MSSQEAFRKRFGEAVRLLFNRGATIRIPQGGGYPNITPTGGLDQWSPEVWDPRTLHQKLQAKLYHQRRVSRNLFQESPLYKRFVLQSLTQVVGSQPLMFEFPQLSDKTRLELKERWIEWQLRGLTPRGQSLAELLKSALYHRIVDGDCLIRILRGPNSKRTDFVVYPGDAFAERSAGMGEDLGIEVGDYNRPKAYWVWKDYFEANKNISLASSRSVERLTPSQAWHIMESDHDSGVLRGHPWAHAVLYLLEQLRLYEDAMITRLKRQAQPYMALKQMLDSGAYSADASSSDYLTKMNLTGADNPVSAAASDPVQILASARSSVDNAFGRQLVLPPGYEPTQINTGTSSGEDVSFIREHIIKMIAAGLGVSDITLASGFDKANFSSAQMAGLGEIEQWRRWQTLLEKKIVRGIWRIFLNEVELTRAPLAAEMGVLYGDARKYPVFSWRKVQVLEVHRMIGAMKQGVDGKIYTRREARESLGLQGNFNDFVQELAAEKESFAENELDNPPPAVPESEPEAEEDPPAADDAEAEDSEDKEK